MDIAQFFKNLSAYFSANNIRSLEEVEQALTMGNVYEKAYYALYQMDDTDYPYIFEIMQGAEEAYVTYTDNGQLYKVAYTVTENDELQLGEPVRVKMEFIEVPQTLKVFRTVEGDYKFLSISACSVINRSGEIDSNELFENFEKNFENHEKPYLTFYHLGKDLQFGEVDQVFRYKNFLVTMGTMFGDHVLTKAAIEKFQTGEWGVSPAFMPTEWEFEEIEQVKIPVYRNGYMIELSVCKEEHAANYFTNIMSVNRNRMMSRTKYEEIIKEFVGEEDKEEALKLLDDVEERQRTIEENKMIFRTEEAEENKQESEEEQQVQGEEIVGEEVVIDDALVDTIAEKVFEKMSETIKQVNDLFENLQVLSDEIEQNNINLKERIGKLEQTDEQKFDEKVRDLPTSRKVRVGYRPTNDGESSEPIKYDDNGAVVINDPTALRKRARKLVGEKK